MIATRRLVLAAVVAIPFTSGKPLGAQQPPTIDRLQSVTPSIAGEPAVWSADGTRLYYLNGVDGALWSVPADGGFPSLVATIDGRATQLRRSPDGAMLTWVKTVSGGTDIFGFDLATGRERRISALSGTVHSYTISPDGRSIALADDRNGSEDIFVVNVASGAAVRIVGSPLYEVFPSWTPDSRQVLYTQLDSRWVDHDVYAIAPEGGQARRLFGDTDYFDYRQGASFGFVQVSPDGKTALFRSQRSGWANYWLIPVAGGEPRPLAAESAEQSDARWSPDGSQVLFLSMTNGTQSLKVAAAGGAARTIVAPETGVVSRAEWSPDGRRIAYQLATPTKANDLYLVDVAGGSARRLTAADPDGSLAANLIVPEKISWPNEGLTIHAYLWRPKTLRPGQRAPVIMYVHGGPTGQFSDSYYLQAQFFASRGYVVIAPNVRGSSGYGKRFEDANNRDWGHGDLRDVLAGVEWAKRQPYVNPGKIGITGISYGGMMTMYAISFAPGVFQAAISGSGYGDVRDFHGIVPVFQHTQLLNYELGPWPSTPEVDSIYRRSSAILKVQDATAPAFLIHGYGLNVLDTDYAAWKYARALAQQGKLVEYKKYPGETYYVYGRENYQEMLGDMLEFFDRYLKDNSTDATAKPPR